MEGSGSCSLAGHFVGVVFLRWIFQMLFNRCYWRLLQKVLGICIIPVCRASHLQTKCSMFGKDPACLTDTTLQPERKTAVICPSQCA